MCPPTRSSSAFNARQNNKLSTVGPLGRGSAAQLSTIGGNRRLPATCRPRARVSRVREVDLRSDTLTMPTPEMRRVMAEAELGDDVFGEDPTVNRLQEVAAERTGKEAALFVSSGTMGNLLGILVNARSGQEVIADADSHVFLSEAGGAAALGGIQIMPVRTEAGVMSPEQVAGAIR